MTADTDANGHDSTGDSTGDASPDRPDDQADDQARARAGDVIHDVVDLDLPMEHRHASTARVVAASLAADAGFTVDEIDDLRLGVDEAVAVLADVDTDAGARLHLRFEIAGSTLTVTATRRGIDRPVTTDDLDILAVRILQAVVDEFRVESDGAFVVVKRAGTDGD